ncbi:Ubiquitin-like-specific protease ESD4 [Vitis vinifera]|uniref:Ubiquitin-like-specific protease ESD4 n=1 Tax=Vitis vinifera TaxID=29760 RepID=A0A438KL95_VITVI|nr:Ubiquitin-like-specific protease ESD4 [Vitis vinifera]
MGALTSNRKRGDECFTLNHTFLSPYPQDLDRRIDSHISKKPRLSSMPQTPDPAVSSRSTASRIQRYPEPTAKLRREVHAPCRVVKFGFAASSNRESRLRIGEVDEKVGLSNVMGNVLSSQYEKAKNTAIQALRYFRKDKEVIDVENERGEDLASEDSSIEEIEAVEDGREGRSVSSSSGVTELSNVNLKMLDSLTLRETDVELGVLPHKKWLDSAEKRNSKLRDLSVQIKFLEAQRSSLHALRPAKKPEEEVPREPFLPLTQEEEAEVDRALSSINRRKVLVTHEISNIEITGEILQCLQPTAWLNDEVVLWVVINVYLELLKEREKREPKKFLKCHFFNTFFYKKVSYLFFYGKLLYHHT